jgi:hypothetical protein
MNGIDDIIKMNLRYLDEMSENKISAMHRIEREITFKKNDAFEHCLVSMLLETMSQYYEFLYAMNDGRPVVTESEFIESITAKVDYIVRRRAAENELH